MDAFLGCTSSMVGAPAGQEVIVEEGSGRGANGTAAATATAAAGGTEIRLNSTRFSRRERPELHMDPSGTGSPLFLTTGVQYDTYQRPGDGSDNDHRYSFVAVQRARGT